MSRKSKVRFAARIDGVERELFSIKERPDNSLLLVSAYPIFWENSDSSIVRFTEQHYSIHISNGGIDTTITQKTKLADGMSHSNVSFIPNTKKHLLWPIYARRVPILLENSRKLSRRSGDKVIFIGDYEFAKANLVYSVFVSNCDFDVNITSLNGLTTYSAKFKHFQIFTIPMYINLPSMNEGDVVGMSTSSTTINNVRSTDHIQLSTHSIPSEYLLSFHFKLMDLLKDKMLQRLSILFQSAPKEMSFSIKMVSLLTALPLVRRPKTKQHIEPDSSPPHENQD
ncbi:hypothetical protein [Zhongshania aquimaris]|uniref:Uncharacterized protein n=1 Tax=Zhongshania aquimaris TaxID=2857107 RepID=A0ABS6VWC7_9GAMM|nr:hypothetical protein [Zhongshania aquimaris]MBW2941936.1 hypothetical protein [Zhongshania aquimaris]